jgi:hypothetical protein
MMIAARPKRIDLCRGRAANSLGTLHGIADRQRFYRTPSPRKSNAIDSTINKFLARGRADRRLDFCGRMVTGPVRLELTGRRARWRGLARCDSWDCPTCAKSKADDAAKRLAVCLERASKAGWFAYMVTLTMPHTVHDTLDRCVRAAREGWRSVRRKLAQNPDVRGWVVSWEVTLGKHGWHVHCHAIVWTADKLNLGFTWFGKPTPNPRTWRGVAQVCENRDVELSAMVAVLTDTKAKSAAQGFALRDERYLLEEEQRASRARATRLCWAYAPMWRFEYDITRAWADGVAKTGMPRPDWRRQDTRPAKTSNVETSKGLIRYLIKTAYEITGQAYKSKNTSFSPRGLLESAARGCHEGRRAWREYRAAMAGLRRIQGLAQLEKKVANLPEIDAVEPPKKATLGRISDFAWMALRGAGWDRLVERLATVGFVDNSRKLLAEVGFNPTRQDWALGLVSCYPARVLRQLGGADVVDVWRPVVVRGTITHGLGSGNITTRLRDDVKLASGVGRKAKERSGQHRGGLDTVQAGGVGLALRGGANGGRPGPVGADLCPAW